MMSAQSAHAEVEESWFVAFGPNDVRTLSLEQLDDAYRLDVITDETLVCSTSMNNWVPLGVVVGSDAPATPVVATPAKASSVAINRAVAAPVPGSDQLFGRAPYEPPPYSPPSQVYSQAPAAYSQSLMPASLAPAAFDLGTPVIHYPTPRSWWKGPMVGLALCVGLFVAYQNNVPEQLAASIGKQTQFEALKARALAAAGIKTPESIDAFMQRVKQEYGLDEIHTLGGRLLGVTAVLGAHAAAPAAQAAPAVQAAAAAVQAPTTATATQPSAVDDKAVAIDSLPRAESESAAPVLANAPAAAPRVVVRQVEPSEPEPKSTPGVLDTTAMREALERSKKKSRKKDRYAKAAQFDPMNSTVE